ncbi:MAG: winged helix-turn-helix domain-containing protein [Ardenticatenaceae bacterium]
MSEQLFLYFQQSGEIIPLKKGIAGRIKEDQTTLVLAQYFAKGNKNLISREHFAIHKRQGQFFIEDLGSTNGTEVNGEKIIARKWKQIQNGSQIILANSSKFVIEVINKNRVDDILAGDTIINTKETKESILTASDDLHHFFLNEEEVNLSDVQRLLIKYLYQNAGRTCSYYKIKRKVWPGGVDNNTVTRMVGNVRKKFDKIDDRSGKKHIRTIRGEGYKLIRKYRED